MTSHGRRESYHQVLRRFYDARHDYDTPHTLARARRLADLYPPAAGARVIDFATGTGIVALAAAPAATVAAIKRAFDRRLEAESRDGLVWAEERIHYVQAGPCHHLPGAILEGTSGGATVPSHTSAAESARHAEAGGVIRVRLFAGLREQAGWGERQVPLRPDEPSPTPASLWRRLDLGAGTAESASGGTGALPPTIRVAVNRAFAGPDAPLHPGDEVAFLPPTSGG